MKGTQYKVPEASYGVQLQTQPVPASDVLQLHMAEYNALTTRNTYLITLQYSLLPALLIYAPLVTALRHRMTDPIRRELMMWGGLAGALFLGHLWAEDLWQQFNNIRYLETQVRPAITEITHAADLVL